MKNSMLLLASVAVVALVAGLPRVDAGDRQTGQAEAAPRALDGAYVEAWKQEGTARQAAALLPLFAEGAVILPGGGTEPRRGLGELREFWFPEGASPTNVRSFEHTVHGVETRAGLGVIYGRSKLEFDYAGDVVAQEGNYLIAAREAADGEWKITQMIWNNRTLP